ncbi:MAG: hypothetical protein EX269_09305 [Acidimicrobiales bacterium]|nr:MAG: hypothetical protein EX269_09305 [Acidimicrobiales bacterium]
MRDLGLIGRLTWAAIAGLAVAVAFSRGELVSLRVWIFAATITLVTSGVAQLIAIARVSTTPPIPAWWPLRKRAAVDRGVIRDVRALEGIIRGAPDNDRVFTLRLQPRLIEIARQYLPITHGIDPGLDQPAARTTLGDVAWLVDPEVTGRTPTLAELDRFLDIVLDNSPPKVVPTS